VLTAEQAVIGCAPAGEQEQGHVDPEGELKQTQNACKQLVEAVVLQRLGGRHATNPIKAEIQAILADSPHLGQLPDGD
jgi:hypothetical protein